MLDSFNVDWILDFMSLLYLLSNNSLISKDSCNKILTEQGIGQKSLKYKEVLDVGIQFSILFPYTFWKRRLPFNLNSLLTYFDKTPSLITKYGQNKVDKTKNWPLIENSQLLSDLHETRWKNLSYWYFIFLEFQLDWIKIVDFLSIGKFQAFLLFLPTL